MSPRLNIVGKKAPMEQLQIFLYVSEGMWCAIKRLLSYFRYKQLHFEVLCRLKSKERSLIWLSHKSNEKVYKIF